MTLDYSKQHVAPKSKRGLFTIEQYLVLKYRAQGYTQLETARALSMSRSNVSMIEFRARNKLSSARKTIKAYHSFLSKQSVVVQKGTRLQDVPSIVLNEGDIRDIHVKSNLVEILRLVKSLKPECIRSGKITRDLRFDLDPRGKLTLVGLRK